MAKVEMILPKEPEYLLTLSADETKFIYDVMYMIGGDPTKSRRKYASELLLTLGSIGFLASGNGLRIPDVYGSNRSIWFSNSEVNSGK